MTSAKAVYKEISIPTVLNPASIRDLTRQLAEAEQEKSRFIVLKGGGAVFCNGLDLAWVANSEDGDYSGDMREYAHFLKKLQNGSFISIAIVQGLVSGGGMGVVCACDEVIADDSSSFSLPEGLLGLIPGMILPSLLYRLSPQRIKKMVLTGKKYPAAVALEYGIVDEISSNLSKSLNDAITTLRACKPNAVQDMKHILYASQLNKDELAQMGMDILNTRLHESDIKQRLKDISDFM